MDVSVVPSLDRGTHVGVLRHAEFKSGLTFELALLFRLVSDTFSKPTKMVAGFRIAQIFSVKLGFSRFKKNYIHDLQYIFWN